MSRTLFDLADRRHVPEAAAAPQQLAFKGADTDTEAVNGQMLAVDEHEGIVTAIVSVTGIEDEVADIIMPGAYRETLNKRRPKVCWAHKWDAPIGRVLHIEELLPGDDRLPRFQRDGKTLWPRDAGALVATMQFNMKAAAGRDAFSAVVFYSETGECEYSIGYQVLPGKSTKDKAGVRHIKALDLYELSVVLFGAHTMTGTLSIKDAGQMARERKHLGGPRGKTATERLAEAKAFVPAKPGEQPGKPKASAAPADQAPPAPGAPAAEKPAEPAPTPDEEKPEVPDFSDGVMVAVYPDAAAADAVAAQIAGPDTVLDRTDLHVTLAFLGNVGDVGMESEEIVRIVTAAVEGMPALEGEIAGIGMFPGGDDGVPTWAPVDVPGLGLLRETLVEALGDAVATDHGFTPHMTLGYDIGLTEPIEPTPVTFSAVRVVYGNQQHDITLGAPIEGQPKSLHLPNGGVLHGDGSGHFPPMSRPTADLATHVKGLDGADIDMDEYIASLTDVDWTALANDPGIKAAADALEMEWKAISPGGRPADDSPVGTPGGRQNWVDKAGGLPKYIRMVAHALIRKGKAKGSAIAIAVATVKKWAANVGGKVSAKVQAAAAKAVAEWEAMKAKPTSGKAAAYDPTLDAPGVEEKGIHASFPYLEGSREETAAEIRRAVVDALQGEPLDQGDNPTAMERYEWDNVCVEGTWDDSLIASRRKWRNDEDLVEHYEMTYEITPIGVELGEPQPIELLLVAHDSKGEETDDYSLADFLPLADEVDHVAYTVKASTPVGVEVKAGRVLSGRNERALRDAVERLIDVLAAAGVKIDPTEDGPRTTEVDPSLDGGDQRVEMDPNVDLETTSPSANRTRGVKVLTREQIAADLASLALD